MDIVQAFASVILGKIPLAKSSDLAELLTVEGLIKLCGKWCRHRKKRKLIYDPELVTLSFRAYTIVHKEGKIIGFEIKET